MTYEPRSAMPRRGLIWVATPLGPFYLDTGNPALPFTRQEVACWTELGIVWDSLTRAVQLALEASGWTRRVIEEAFVRAFFAAARAAGWRR